MKINNNSITLTNKDQNVSWILAPNELNLFLSDLSSDIAYGKMSRGKSKFRLKVVSATVGIILNSPVTEFCYRTIFEYIKSKGFQKVEKKRGRPKKEIFYYTDVDDIEEANVSGGDIKWHPFGS